MIFANRLFKLKTILQPSLKEKTDLDQINISAKFSNSPQNQ